MRNSRRTKFGILAAAALAAAALVQPVLAGGASAAGAISPTATTRPTTTKPIPGPGQVCRVIAFDRAEAVRSTSGEVTLYVSGVATTSGVTVKLVPLVYIQQPDYWGIEVIGCSSRITLPVLTPYQVKADVTSTVGTSGIEVIGSNQSVKIVLRPTKTA